MQSGKVIPEKIPGEVYQAMEDVVGKEWISDDRAILETYSKFTIAPDSALAKFEKNPIFIPACVVLPANTEEVQSLVRIACRYKIPIIPFTNGQQGSAPSSPGTVMIHLRRMDRILDIDKEEMTATLEPYVSYAQLQAEVMKKGLWNGGCPLATSITKIVSQVSLAGLWQTDLKYGSLNRNIVNVKTILPNGDLMCTGSTSVTGIKDFREYGPGPDILGLLRCSAATCGIFTEVTVKLHPWPGEPSLPEDVGVPSIPTYYKDVKEKKFDRPLVPKNHKIYWVEYPDLTSEIETLYQISHAGIGIALNACGIYSDYFCSQTQEMTEERARKHFFPPFNIYVMLAGITSPKQLEYEERVLKDIVEERGGKFLSEEYKPEVLDALGTWNQDCLRSVCGFRMNRRGGFLSALIPSTRIDSAARDVSAMWGKILNRLKPIHITDLGGSEGTPFVYVFNRGHFSASETDNYYSQSDPKELAKTMEFLFDCHAAMIDGKIGHWIANMLFEPFTSCSPEVGPNSNLFWRKVRQAFDREGICAPGKKAFTQEEFEAFDQKMLDAINRARVAHGLEEVKR